MRYDYIYYGDNLPILQELDRNGLHGKVDLIYIDPPFATGDEFTAGNGRSATISNGDGDVAYDDSLTGDAYLSFLRKRLVAMYQLLSPQGSIYVHDDDKSGPYVKVLLDSIFGKRNFLNMIARCKSNPKNFKRNAYGNDHDLILFYAKHRGKNIFNDVRIPSTPAELASKYPHHDERGHYTTVPLHAPGISHGVTGEPWNGLNPPVGRHWRTDPHRLTELDRVGRVYWSRNGNPRLKEYASSDHGRKMQDIWLDYQDPQKSVYPTQKNQRMLDTIVRQSSKPGSVVLDAFAGSGGTLASARKYGRRFIGIDRSSVAWRVMQKRFGNDGDVVFKKKVIDHENV